MKVAIATSATAGGAGIAAQRLALALRTHTGHEIDLLDVDAMGAVAAEVSPQVSATNGKVSDTHYTADHANAVREWVVRFFAQYDVVNLHWTSYLLSAAEILALARAGVRLLLTMHDFNAVTGGCHYPAGCTGLFADCGGCPQVDESVFPASEVRRLKTIKAATLRHPNVHLCAPSEYVLSRAGRAASVPVQRRHLIRNPYAPIADTEAASSGNRPFTVLLIADSLSERRKGAALAADALRLFASLRHERGQALRLHVVGAADGNLIVSLRDTGADLHVHGRVTDHERLARLYTDCDVQLATSYEDNWPNVLSEASAYGCLAVVGPGHGCEEFVRTLDAGVVASSYSPDTMARALADVAAVGAETLAARRAALAAAVRKEHDPASVADAYLKAFASIGNVAGPAHETGAAPDAALSSNYLGAYSRWAVAATRLGEEAYLDVSIANAATPSKAIRLHAAYGKPESIRITTVTMSDAHAWLPIMTDAGRLCHVFASEKSDYGLTRMRCEIASRTEPPVVNLSDPLPWNGRAASR